MKDNTSHYICVGMEIFNFRPNITQQEFNQMLIDLTKLDSQLIEARKTYLEIVKLMEKNKEDIEYYSFFFSPSVIISEVKNQKVGHKWIGRVRVPESMLLEEFKGKRPYLFFTICDGSKFNSKDDPNLLALAQEMAIEKIKSKVIQKNK